MRRPSLAWTLWAASIMLVAAAVILVAVSRHAPAPVALLFRGSEAILAVSMATVGLVITVRRPGHRIGWLFCGAGVVASLLVLGEHYAVYSYLSIAQPLPGAAFAAWLQSWVGPGGYFPLLSFLLLLFPTGHLSSRRWRPVAGLVIVGAVLVSVGLALRPGPVDVLTFIDNPIGAKGRAGDAFRAMASVGQTLQFAGIVLASIAFVVRARRSRGIERKQLKWLSSAVVLVAVVFVGIIAYGPDRMPFVVNVLFLATLVAIPVATAIAIVRHELFDIDRIISRTLSYAIVTALLGGLFALFVLVPTAVISSRDTPGWLVALATMVVFGLFRPVLGRVRSIVDRRFDRSRYDAVRTIDAFAARLREEIDIDALGAELREVVRSTMRPEHVWLWMRGGTA